MIVICSPFVITSQIYYRRDTASQCVFSILTITIATITTIIFIAIIIVIIIIATIIIILILFQFCLRKISPLSDGSDQSLDNFSLLRAST